MHYGCSYAQVSNAGIGYRPHFRSWRIDPVPMSDAYNGTLVSLQPRINLSPFTKDFRGEEQLNESIDQFF